MTNLCPLFVLLHAVVPFRPNQKTHNPHQFANVGSMRVQYRCQVYLEGIIMKKFAYLRLSKLPKVSFLFIFLLLIASRIYATPDDTHGLPATIPADQLKGFNNYPNKVKTLISIALKLSSEQLTYTYGSADPKNGGMDCSGTIYYLLNSLHIPGAPRQANEIYQWAWQKGHFYAVNSSSFNSFEFSHLQPGDLLFWSGTYEVKRDPPVTHVMIYLGENQNGKKLMFGSSNGRPYEGISRWGVSVFDFNLPTADSKSRFLGYSCIPDYSC